MPLQPFLARRRSSRSRSHRGVAALVAAAPDRRDAIPWADARSCKRGVAGTCHRNANCSIKYICRDIYNAIAFWRYACQYACVRVATRFVPSFSVIASIVRLSIRL